MPGRQNGQRGPTASTVVAPAAATPPRPEALALRDRQAEVRTWWTGNGAPPAELLGVAISGGGIRSATFSLGALQALACDGSLKSVDVLSTVSGGSYVGCFLRSLFLPGRLRGIEPADRARPLRDGEIETQYDFALRALRSGAGVRTIDGVGVPNDPQAPRPQVCNPIWWLREHSRYLAPNGPSDFGYAAAYLSRNWLAMLYVFAVGAAALLAASATVEAAGWWLLDRLAQDGLARLPEWLSGPARPPPPGGCDVHMVSAGNAAGIFACAADQTGAPAGSPVWQLLSPLLAVAALPAILSLGLSTAYWLTAQMSVNERDPGRQLRSFGRVGGWLLVTVVLVGAGVGLLADVKPVARLAATGALGLIGFELLLGILMLARVRASVEPPQLLTAELRRRLTGALATSNGWALALLGAGLVETLGAWLRRWAWHADLGTLSGAALLPALAFLIKKLPDWLGGAADKGWFQALVARFLPAIALAAGALLYGSVAVVVDALVQAAVWTGDSWWSPPDPTTGAMMLLTVLPLAWLTGRSTGFINLSSLHNLYASRLIRAYLGASNVDRLRSLADPHTDDVGIRDNHELDYIQPAIYEQRDLPAPLHVINATLNRTIDTRSQLVSRDRKGEPVTIEPAGVRVGTAPDDLLLRWSGIGRRKYAESLSLGQWLAISGAAASSGMGRLTSLGYAVALTFANVRLGFWWWMPQGRRWERERRDAAGRGGAVWARLAGPASTFFYLANEMTARYSATYDRQYLSDGGHFENTGAYALVRRDVPRIVVFDNGADPGYLFADLENLVRKVRIDLQGEMTLLGGPALAAFLRGIGCTRPAVFADPQQDPDWKAAWRRGEGGSFALAFEIVRRPPGDCAETRLNVVLVKPRALPGMPEDLAVYAAANPDFPQQSTGDLFFDEAQWESYRRLGQFTMARLLDACPSLFRDR